MGTIKERLRSGDGHIAGFFNLIPSAVTTQALATAGTDFMVVGLEHSP